MSQINPNVDQNIHKFDGIDSCAKLPVSKGPSTKSCYTALSVVQWFLLGVVFVMSLTSLIISLRPPQSCRVVQDVDIPFNELRAAIERLKEDNCCNEINKELTDLKEILSNISVKYESLYNELNATISTAIESVQSVSVSSELNLTFGCVEIVSECHVARQGDSPQFASCETSTLDVVVEGFTNVNVYCSVDNTVQETNPVLSTLNIYGGQITCLCNVLDYSSSTLIPTCRLHVRRCPNTIQLNGTTKSMP